MRDVLDTIVFGFNVFGTKAIILYIVVIIVLIAIGVFARRGGAAR